MRIIILAATLAVRWTLYIAGNIAGRLLLWSHRVQAGKGMSLNGLPIISRTPGSKIRLGQHVVLCSRSTATALGVNHPVILRTMTSEAEIIIGDDVGVSGVTICAARRISIGAECLIGANVMIIDNDFHPIAAQGRRYNRSGHPVDAKEITVGRNVFIGANTIVLKGVEIGDNSVIGAGSVVTSSIPSSVIAAGNPCRVLRPLPSDGAEVRAS